MDDLNYLLHREQAERMNARSAICAESRRAHHEMAEIYAQRIFDHPSPYRSKQTDGSVPFADLVTAH